MSHNEFATPEEMCDLTRADIEELDELSKGCPRCGSVSANKSNPSGRCRACLNKLAANKQKPGHWQRAQTKFDDSKRRENGKNGTASYKSKGRAKSRKDFVSRFKNDEKKTGEKLSPDRIDNSRGYESKNVRNIKQSLNRGRHKVDPKKLKAWRSRIKKNDITEDLMYTALLSKAARDDNQELLTLLGALTPAEVNTLIDNLENIDAGST